MKREIKLRAWDTVGKEWIKDFYIIPDTGEIMIGEDSCGACDQSKYSTVERSIKIIQFTGLKDKNGKEIYEGDIVRNENDQKQNQQIIFAKGMFCLDDEDSPLWKYDPKNFWEIIGDIYSNPELLK